MKRKCTHCDKMYSSIWNLNRHLKGMNSCHRKRSSVQVDTQPSKKTYLKVHVNRPPMYKKRETFDTFEVNRPYIQGYARLHYLTKPIMLVLNQGHPVRSYLNHINGTLAFWHLEKDDVVQINSLTYELAKRKRLDGHIKYLESRDYHFFKMDSQSQIFNHEGQAISMDLLDNVEGMVCLKVFGLTQSCVTDDIRPLVHVHQIKLEPEDKENIPCMFI